MHPGAPLHAGGRSTMLRAFLLVCCVQLAASFSFEMNKSNKCIMEELNKDVLVVGTYEAVNKALTMAKVVINIDVTVEDPLGQVLFKSLQKPQGQFVFTTVEAGDYKICFTVRDARRALETKIDFDLKTGVAAQDWDAIAKKENLDMMGVELRKLELTVREIHDRMLYLRKREEEMRDLNEATNARVAIYSISSLVVCLALAVWQLWYLRSFFQRKKLL